jgi:hypothetical protein
MKWFRFEIPLNSDGTRISYSPGYHGTMPQCPSKVTVVLYNDKEGYGIAMTEDTKPLPKEVTSLTKSAHDKALSEVVSIEPIFVDGIKIQDGIYKGTAITTRAEWNLEPIKEDLPVDFDAGFGEVIP